MAHLRTCSTYMDFTSPARIGDFFVKSGNFAKFALKWSLKTGKKLMDLTIKDGDKTHSLPHLIPLQKNVTYSMNFGSPYVWH